MTRWNRWGTNRHRYQDDFFLSFFSSSEPQRIIAHFFSTNKQYYSPPRFRAIDEKKTITRDANKSHGNVFFLSYWSGRRFFIARSSPSFPPLSLSFYSSCSRFFSFWLFPSIASPFDVFLRRFTSWNDINELRTIFFQFFWTDSNEGEDNNNKNLWAE